jgi:hypothetical protein
MIVSDGDKKKLSIFWQKLFRLVGIELTPNTVNVLNLHKIDLARKYYTHLQREIKKEEEGEKEWKNSH